MEAGTDPQDTMQPAEPQEQHRWLRKLVGDWTFESEATMKPGEPPVKLDGTERVRALGDLWVLAEGEGEMPGAGDATMLMTLGYDPARGCYVGTWIGSMMTHLWVYEGTMDEGGSVLTLEAEGPGPDGTIQTYRDVIELVGDDERTLRSFAPGEDGQWHEFMVATYHRR